jgi:hypothetical protein
MFVSFLEPFPIRNNKAPFLWVFYKQLHELGTEDIVYIGSEEYFKVEHKNEMNKDFQEKFEYEIDIHKINNAEKYIISEEIYRDLKGTNIEKWKYLMKNSYINLVNRLDEIFSEISKKNKIDAVFAWCNSPSLNEVAKKYNIPVIYNELGPLRKTQYMNFAYFDFSGVNGNTEASERYEKFKKEISKNDLLSLEDIRYLVLKDHLQLEAFKNINEKIGVALQVEDDSNIIAYSKGWDSFKLLDYVSSEYKKENVLIRNHPLASFQVKDEKWGEIDKSVNSIEFLSKIKKLITINSSVGFEALLYEKEVEILGDSPFSLMSGKKDKNEFKYFVNFIIFGYLIHYSLLYNREYYLWRLKNFNEKDIFNKNKEYVLSLAGVGKKCIKSEILIREIKDYKKLLEDKNKIINAYKTDLDKKTGIIYTQKEKINGFVEEIKKRENIISKQAQQIEHLHNEINKKNEIIDTQKEQMKNELAKKDEVIHNYARQIDKLNSQLKNKNIEVKKLNEKINVLNNEIYEIYSSKTYKLASMLRNIKRRIW